MILTPEQRQERLPLVRDEFFTWLPGELVYSEAKAPFMPDPTRPLRTSKLERALLKPEQEGSMTDFLSKEWFQAQRLLREGVIYIPDHAMSAQLQYAKFAAGIFDKAVMALKVGQLQDPSQLYEDAGDIHQVSSHTDYVVEAAKDRRKSFEAHAVKDRMTEEVARLAFEHTPFGMQDTGIPRIQTDIAAEKYLRAYFLALGLGLRALDVYERFALKHLEPEQYVIPVSKVA